MKKESEIEFGIVSVVKGKHKGKVGYYDDDELDDNGKLKAVVYFGEPFESQYLFVPHNYLNEASEYEKKLYLDSLPKNCKFPDYMGVNLSTSTNIKLKDIN